ncbi:MAG: serine/threonine protein kinase [Deltaproteobacteria bacterium]|nr:serine/threonine protein kinase [Deltaproteobacteria bacterium]
MDATDYPAPMLAGQVLAGKYRVESCLGEGGMGRVLKARHCELGRAVAIKVLRPGAGELSRLRFMREARAASRIPSEHVARVYDVGQLDNGQPFMVMELLDGRDLADVIYEDGELSIERAVEYVLHACEALAAAHARGIVHRDVKPANLFLTHQADGTPIIKLLDFGVSKDALAASATPNPLTRTNAVLGSPVFMSPEQLACSRDVDHRADVWSLGVTLFELLTVEPAFAGESLAELYSAILRDEPCRLRVLRPDAPEELEEVLLRCLCKEPDDRVQTVVELAELLGPFAPARAREKLARLRELSIPPQDETPEITALPLDSEEALLFAELEDDSPVSGQLATQQLSLRDLEQLDGLDRTPGATFRPAASDGERTRMGLPLSGALLIGAVLGVSLTAALLWQQRVPLQLSSMPPVTVPAEAPPVQQPSPPPPAPQASASLANPFADSVLLSKADRQRLEAQLQQAEDELAARQDQQAIRQVKGVLRELLDRGVRPNETVSALGARSLLLLGRVEAMRVRQLLATPTSRKEAKRLDAKLDRQLAQARKAYGLVHVWGVRSMFRCGLVELAELDAAAGKLFFEAAALVPEQRAWLADRSRKHLRHARTGYRHALDVRAETALCTAEAQVGRQDTQRALEELAVLESGGR